MLFSEVTVKPYMNEVRTPITPHLLLAREVTNSYTVITDYFYVYQKNMNFRMKPFLGASLGGVLVCVVAFKRRSVLDLLVFPFILYYHQVVRRRGGLR